MEQIVPIRTASGEMETFIAHPGSGGPWIPVILYMDIWGFRDGLNEVARMVAREGYYCLVPDLYYRQGRVRQPYRDANGRTTAVRKMPEANQKITMTAARSLTDAMVIEDTRALIQFLDSGQATAARPMACIGYCMGGRHAIRVAAAFTDRFKATASLHGTELVTDHPDSAHLDAQKVTGELYCAYAERDPHGSERVRTVMAEAMKSGRARYIAGFHENAEHGYAIPDRDVYLKDATDRDWQEFFSMIGRMSAA